MEYNDSQKVGSKVYTMSALMGTAPIPALTLLSNLQMRSRTIQMNGRGSRQEKQPVITPDFM